MLSLPALKCVCLESGSFLRHLRFTGFVAPAGNSLLCSIPGLELVYSLQCCWKHVLIFSLSGKCVHRWEITGCAFFLHIAGPWLCCLFVVVFEIFFCGGLTLAVLEQCPQYRLSSLCRPDCHYFQVLGLKVYATIMSLLFNCFFFLKKKVLTALLLKIKHELKCYW